MKKLYRILPFMDREEIEELAFQIINGEVEGVKLVVLFPFLQSETLEKIVDTLIEKGDGKQLTRAIPFASRESINKIYAAIQAGTLKGVKEEYLFPFLGKSELKKMFKVLVKQAKDAPDTDEDDEHVEFHFEFDIDSEDEEVEVEVKALEDEIEVEVEALEDEMKILQKRLKKLKK